MIHLFNKISRVISTLMASFLSYANRRSFCLIGLAIAETFKECSISSQGTTGMSTGFHANTSMCCLRKLMSASSYLGLRSALIRAVLDWSPGSRTTSFMSLDLVEARAASMVGISRSYEEICYEDVRQSYMQIEMSVASASAKLSFSQE